MKDYFIEMFKHFIRSKRSTGLREITDNKIIVGTIQGEVSRQPITERRHTS